MATMRLLARDAQAMALLPSVVVRDELRSRTLAEYAPVPGLFESFYAVTAARQFPHPTVKALLARDEAELLGGDREA
jgi:LysR family transcriptional activator of nhaA